MADDGTVPVSDSRSADALLVSMLGGCADDIVRHRSAAIESGEPEALHAVRVALRRLRTALGILRREAPCPAVDALAEAARGINAPLGRSRNWDVFVTETLPRWQAEAENAVPDLEAGAQRQRLAAAGAMRAVLSGKDMQEFLEALRQAIAERPWLSATPALACEPASAFTARTLARLRARTLRIGRHFRRHTPDRRHRLRVAFKKLRYAIGFFEDIYGDNPALRRFSSALAALQDDLGADNDMVVARTLLDDLLSEDAALAPALEAMRRWSHKEQQRRAAETRRRWCRLKRRKPFWR